VGEPVTFDGSGSQPGSFPISSYTWDFGDGSGGDGATVTHVYNAAGTYQVTLTVTDEQGFANVGGPVGITITESEVPEPTPTETETVLPSAVINAPPEGKVGEPVTFDGSGSQPGSFPIASYTWDFGDGSGGDGATVTHVYNAAGTYQVTLTVTDEQGFANAGGVGIAITE
jgi:chitinase